MVLVRHGVRQHRLAAFGYRFTAQDVRPDWVTFGVFLVCLVAAALVIGKMTSWVLADLRRSGGA
jgi:hypothetical protein